MAPTDELTLYVPCDVVAYRLSLSYGKSVSTLERTVLALVHAIAKDRSEQRDKRPVMVSDLREALGIGERLTLDVVHDLWRKSHLAVDLRSGALGLSRNAQEHADTGNLALLESAEAKERTVDLMVERLTGRVLPRTGAKTPGVPVLAIEPEPEDTSIDHVPPGDLVIALDSAVSALHRAADRPRVEDLLERRPERPDIRPVHIVGYRRVMSEKAVAGRRWLPVDVRVGVNPDTERPSVTVVDTALTPTQRQRAAERLMTLVEEMPNGRLARQLAERAGNEMAGAAPIEDILADIAARVERLASVPVGGRTTAHDEAVAATRHAAVAMAELNAGQTQVTLVRRTDLADARAGVFAATRRQLVLVVPQLTRPTWDELETPIVDLLTKSVQVVLLWGDKPGATLDPQVRNLLIQLLRRSKDNQLPFVMSLTSAATRTGMLVADDGVALINGASDVDPSGSALAAVRLSAAVPQDGAETVRRLLGWVCRQVPDGRNSRRVAIRADEFRRPRPVADTATTFPMPRTPQPPPDDQTAEVVDGAVASWCDAWALVLRELTGLRSAITLPVPNLVEGLRHADLLWYAVRNARRRLVIGSTRLDKSVVDDVFLGALCDRLREGVEVTVAIPQRQEGAGGGKASSPRARLLALVEAFPGEMRIVPAAGHFLVCDDDVLLSGFDLLRDGVRGARKPGGRRPSQLGVRFQHERLADRLAAITGAVAGSPWTPQDAAPAPSVDDALIRPRQFIMNAAHGPKLGAEVARRMAEVADPWALVASLAPTADDQVIEAATAHCLLTYPDGAPAEAMHGLVLRRWRAGDYVTAAGLRTADPDPAHHPRRPVALAAAAIGTGHLPDALAAAAAVPDLDPGERAALLAVACRQLAQTGAPAAAAVVAELGERSVGVWRELADAMAVGQAYSPAVPLAEVAAGVRTAEQHATDVENTWDGLERMLVLCKQPPRNLDGSIKTVHRLFRSDAPFGQLLAACGERDGVAVEGVVATAFPVGGRSAMEVAIALLDRTWAAVTTATSKPLHSGARRDYLNRLAEAVDLARRLVAAPDAAMVVDEQAAAAVQDLLSELTALRPRLLADTTFAGTELSLVRREVGALMTDLGVAGSSPRAVNPGLGEAFGEDAPLQVRILGEWPQRWRYPGLSRLRPGAVIDDAAIVTALLCGMADPVPLLEAGRRLVADGAFEQVDRMIENAPLSAAEVRTLAAEVAAARRTRRADHEQRLTLLEQRRQALGGDWAAGPSRRIEELLDEGHDDPGELERFIGELEGDADEATAGRALALEADLEDQRAVGASASWAATVKGCIGAGEFEAAQELLRHPKRIPDGGPATVARPPLWRGVEPLTEVLDAMLGERDAAHQGLDQIIDEHVMPLAHDVDAWRLLAAMRPLAEPGEDERNAATSMTAFVEALHRLFGTTDVPIAVERHPGGFRSSLYIARDHRLPPLRPLAEGMPLWIADAATAPPTDVDRPLAWLVPEIKPEVVGQDGVAVVSADALLTMLAPTAGGVLPRPSDRQIQLLRLVGRQWTAPLLIGARRGIELGSGLSPDHRLSWLFDLLGYRLDPVVRSVLLHDTGKLPYDLRIVIDALLEQAGPRSGDLRRTVTIGPEGLAHVRRSNLVRNVRVRHLLAMLDDHPQAKAVLLGVVWLDNGAIRVHPHREIHEALAVLLDADGPGSDLLFSCDDVEAAALLLVQFGLWERGGRPGEFRPVPSGLWLMLVAEPEIGSQVVAAAVEARRQRELRTTDTQRIQDLVAKTIDHHNENLRRDRAELNEKLVTETDIQARRRIFVELKRLDEEAMAYAPLLREATAAPSPQSLHALLDAAKYRVVARTGGSVELKLDGPDDLLVAANRWLLGEAFYCLLDNARLATVYRGGTYGYIAVTVAVEDLDGVERCVIDIHDSGVGIADDVLRELRRGEPVTRWPREGHGEGFLLASSWIVAYGGSLVVESARTEPLGGAHVRAKLPLLSRVADM